MTPYQHAIQLLKKVATPQGFLASANDIANYKRVWARDGVICGLAGILDGDKTLVAAMKNTLRTLADHQHENGMIPSNVYFEGEKSSVSYGGLAGRVDTVAWFIIGVCQYTYKTGDTAFFKQLQPHIHKGFQIQQSWEYNAGDLMYVPRSGNWADEYPTQGFILYDQLLRLWALRSYLHFDDDVTLRKKEKAITEKIVANYKKSTSKENRYHPNAYKELKETPYWVASLEPAGYQTQFDAFATSLALLLNIGESQDHKELINYTETLRLSLDLQLVPAFWPVIQEGDDDWKWLTNNCKYEFRNYPYEFHNGGTWQMVNGFYGMGLAIHKEEEKARQVHAQIEKLNQVEDWRFYENFNSKTGAPNGVPFCTWSAAGSVLLEQTLTNNKLLV
ncbi:glycoside hydrolase 100 family protein [uncultured Dokdonia sp.]|uniref:glycoside hydrolase 100 family protein n=1 Tax=uncultured Dokdonia sp. TaxID=575653 RepID=UPI002629D052|nr:glycoside hydrolase 100 family protein [uncultured Dokdonia sp.]